MPIRAAQGVDLPHQMPLGGAADGGVAGHIADKVQREGKDRGFLPPASPPRGRPRCRHGPRRSQSRHSCQDGRSKRFRPFISGNGAGRSALLRQNARRVHHAAPGMVRVVVNRQRFPALQVGGGGRTRCSRCCSSGCGHRGRSSCTGSPRDAARSSKSGGPASRPQCGRWSGCRGPSSRGNDPVPVDGQPGHPGPQPAEQHPEPAEHQRQLPVHAPLVEKQRRHRTEDDADHQEQHPAEGQKLFSCQITRRIICPHRRWRIPRRSPPRRRPRR